jgi:hypothetical protein
LHWEYTVVVAESPDKRWRWRVSVPVRTTECATDFASAAEAKRHFSTRGWSRGSGAARSRDKTGPETVRAPMHVMVRCFTRSLMAKKKSSRAGQDVGAGAFAGEVVGNVMGQLLADGAEQLMARFKPSAGETQPKPPDPARGMLERLAAAGDGGADVASVLAAATGG